MLHWLLGQYRMCIRKKLKIHDVLLLFKWSRCHCQTTKRQGQRDQVKALMCLSRMIISIIVDFGLQRKL